MKKIQQELSQEDIKQLKIKKYLLVYIKELERHFDVSNLEIRKILYDIYLDTKPINSIEIFVKNYINMLKSKCETIKKEINGNKIV